MTMETQEILDPTGSILKLPKKTFGGFLSQGMGIPQVTLSVSMT